MRSAISRLVGFLFGATLTVLIVMDMVWAQNPLTGRIKGTAFRLLWDKKSPLECGGNMVMVFRGDSLDLERGPVFDAGGRCQLTLNGVRARAPQVLRAGGDARVIIEGGRLEGTETALEAGGSAVVQVRGSVLLGAIHQGGSARIEGLEGDPRVRPQVAAKDAAAAESTATLLCRGLLDCYAQANEFGDISGAVVARLSAAGDVQGVSYEGRASQGVQACMLGLVRGRKAEGHHLGAGRVRCEYAGVYMRAGQMLAVEARFEPDKAARPEKAPARPPEKKKRKRPRP